MSTARTDETKQDDQPIEAGEVRELQELSFREAEHRAETAKSLAIWLVVILGVSIVLRYILTVIMAFGGKEEGIKNLNAIFNAWLPAISSLVSAAATYYFTKETCATTYEIARASDGGKPSFTGKPGLWRA